jgi:exosortase
VIRVRQNRRGKCQGRCTSPNLRITDNQIADNQITRRQESHLSRRTTYFVLLITAAAFISWSALAATYGIAQGDQQSHILLIFPVSLILLYSERDRVFRDVKRCLPAGVVFVLFGSASVWLSGHPLPLGQDDRLSLQMSLFIVSCVAAFILCYGTSAFRVAAFPLLFLFFMVPIPAFLLERTIWLLQKGTTDVAFLALKVANIPVAREGFVMFLPRFDIEVATECSGIRSSLMLVIVTLVLGQLFLRANWKKFMVALLVLPIAVMKNGFRIVVLAVLGTNVDPSLLHGSLHRYGGIPSFGLALGAVMFIVWQLHKTEKESQTTAMSYANATHNPEFVKGGV